MQAKAELVFYQNLPEDQADELVMNEVVAEELESRRLEDPASRMKLRQLLDPYSYGYNQDPDDLRLTGAEDVADDGFAHAGAEFHPPELGWAAIAFSDGQEGAVGERSQDIIRTGCGAQDGGPAAVVESSSMFLIAGRQSPV